MNDADSVPSWFPFAFPVFFAAMWLFVTATQAAISGWPRLAQRFPAERRPDGVRLRGQVVSVGLIWENSITHMIVSSAGLYLYPNMMFRIGRRPVLLPWSEVRHVSETRFLGWHTHAVRLGDTVTIRVRDKAYRAIACHLPATSRGVA